MKKFRKISLQAGTGTKNNKLPGLSSAPRPRIKNHRDQKKLVPHISNHFVAREILYRTVYRSRGFVLAI